MLENIISHRENNSRKFVSLCRYLLKLSEKHILKLKYAHFQDIQIPCFEYARRNDMINQQCELEGQGTNFKTSSFISAFGIPLLRSIISSHSKGLQPFPM